MASLLVRWLFVGVAGGLLAGSGVVTNTLDAQPAPRVVVDVEPSARVLSDGKSTKREVLTPTARAKNRITVVEQDGRYFWASREYRELQRIQSGVFVVFADPQGGGLVKVLDQRTVPRSSLLRLDGPDVQVLEISHAFLSTVSYWGAGGRVELEARPAGAR